MFVINIQNLKTAETINTTSTKGTQIRTPCFYGILTRRPCFHVEKKKYTVSCNLRSSMHKAKVSRSLKIVNQHAALVWSEENTALLN